MFLTEEEILGTSAALNLTCDYFGQNAEMIDAFFAANAQRKFTVMGCGSSYMLSKSAARRRRRTRSRPATILPTPHSGRIPSAAASS